MADIVTLRLTLDECTALMHALEVAKDEARKALHLAHAPRNPYHKPLAWDIQEKQRNAAGQTYQNVTELCDYVTGIWQDAMGEERDRRDLLAAQ